MRVRLLAIALVLLSAATAPAAELTPEQRTLFDGFAAHRRVALGYLRTGNADLAAVEIERLILRKAIPIKHALCSNVRQHHSRNGVTRLASACSRTASWN